MNMGWEQVWAQALSSGHIADLLVALIVLELLALAWRRRSRLAQAWPGLLAGLWLALALRSVLTGAPWFWLAVCLMAAGLAHAVDVRRRWWL